MQRDSEGDKRPSAAQLVGVLNAEEVQAAIFARRDAMRQRQATADGGGSSVVLHVSGLDAVTQPRATRPPDFINLRSTTKGVQAALTPLRGGDAVDNAAASRRLGRKEVTKQGQTTPVY
ncbi:hypothetical protein ATCC90586_011852 [Pythium insidiosum]|nr:hypothetical protein ATCC90586_011852 [Pythium insidiosum]